MLESETVRVADRILHFQLSGTLRVRPTPPERVALQQNLIGWGSRGTYPSRDGELDSY